VPGPAFMGLFWVYQGNSERIAKIPFFVCIRGVSHPGDTNKYSIRGGVPG
jgi:hypothetical protein